MARKCGGRCSEIYRKTHGHIRRRAHEDEKILGSKGLFCAAFYHVPEWNHFQEQRLRQHFCLDENTCIIGKRATKSMQAFSQVAKKFVKQAKQFAKQAEQSDTEDEQCDNEDEQCDNEDEQSDSKDEQSDSEDEQSDDEEGQFGSVAEVFDSEVEVFGSEAEVFGNEAKQFVNEVKQLGNATEGNKYAQKAHEFKITACKFKTKVTKFKNKTKASLQNEPFKKYASEFVCKALEFQKKATKAARAWYAQPRTVVAVVKFEKKDGSILYEARYTNCTPKKQTKIHAEDFFKQDIEDNGELNQLVQDKPNGTITLYLTLQPCHMSIDTKNADTNQSCCKTLKNIVAQKLRADGRKIDLCVKATHTNALSLGNQRGKYKKLQQNAEKGIKELMRTEGVNVSEMTHKDWDYLFSMTEKFSTRQVLDSDVQNIFEQIHRINLL